MAPLLPTVRFVRTSRLPPSKRINMADLHETYVLFELSGATYAIPSSEVLCLEMLEHVTLVPNAHRAVEGVVFSRGQVIPALNLRVRFGFPREERNLRTRVI